MRDACTLYDLSKLKFQFNKHVEAFDHVHANIFPLRFVLVLYRIVLFLYHLN